MWHMLKNILMWVMLLAFLVSATGFRLVKHTCPSCNIVEYSLHESKSCCTSTAAEDVPEHISCCSIGTEPVSCSTAFAATSCCEFESKLFVVDELVAPQTFKLEAAQANQPLVLSHLNVPAEVSNDQFLAAFLHPPPPSLSGTDYLFFLHQLKIAFC
jgi:hypothetical protein